MMSKLNIAAIMIAVRVNKIKVLQLNWFPPSVVEETVID